MHVETTAHRLGHGLFGSVYRGVLGQTQVAVKEVNSKVSQEFAAQEIEIMRYLGRHPNIVYMFHGELMNPNDTIIARIILQLCDCSLADITPAHSTVPVAFVRQLVPQFYQMLAYLQSKRVVHRDIKPSNLLLIGAHTLKLADFGLAVKINDHIPTICKGGTGTPNYMAPECFGRSCVVTTAMDMWSVGMVLYKIVVGTVPFTAKTKDELAVQIKSLSVELPATVPTELSTLIKHMLCEVSTRMDVMTFADHPWSRSVASPASITHELRTAIYDEDNQTAPPCKFAAFSSLDDMPVSGIRYDNAYAYTMDYCETSSAFDVFVSTAKNCADDQNMVCYERELEMLCKALAAAQRCALHLDAVQRQAISMFIFYIVQPHVYKLSCQLDQLSTPASPMMVMGARKAQCMLAWFRTCAKEWDFANRPLPFHHPVHCLVMFCKRHAEWVWSSVTAADERDAMLQGTKELSALLSFWKV